MVGFDRGELADQGVVLDVGDLGVVEPVVALVVVCDEPCGAPRLRATGSVTGRLGNVAGVARSCRDARSDHPVGIVAVVERDRLAGCHPSLGRGELDGEAVPWRISVQNDGAPCALHWAIACTLALSGAAPACVPVGSPSTQVTACSSTDRCEAASGGPTVTVRRRHVHCGHVPPTPVGAVPHAPALPDGHQLHCLDGAEVPAGLVVDQPAGVEREALGEEAAPDPRRSG